MEKQEMEKNFIKLDVIAFIETTNKVFFKVKNNKRYQNFNNGFSFFEASNGITIRSIAYPSYNSTKLLLVQGEEKRLDDIILQASTDEFKKLQEAAEEYNKKFSVHVN